MSEVGDGVSVACCTNPQLRLRARVNICFFPTPLSSLTLNPPGSFIPTVTGRWMIQMSESASKVVGMATLVGMA